MTDMDVNSLYEVSQSTHPVVTCITWSHVVDLALLYETHCCTCLAGATRLQALL